MIKRYLTFTQLFLIAILAIVLILLLFNPKETYTDLDRFLEAQYKNFNFPSLCGAYVTLGEPTVYFSYGDIGTKQSPTPDTLYYIASLSKSFTALSVVKACRHNNISLDTQITQIIPEFSFYENNPITIRHLLAHASGLSDRVFQENLPTNATIYAGAMALKDARPLSPVETDFHYFNMGYTFLGYLLEKISGRSYSEYLQDELITALNLNDTCFSKPKLHLAAIGYSSIFGLSFKLKDPKRAYALPSGFLLSSVRDLVTLANYYLDPSSLPQNSGFVPEDFQIVQTPAFVGWPYGLGWFTGIENNQNVVQHGGSLDGFISQFHMWPDHKKAFIFLTNSCDNIQLLFGANIIVKGVKDILFEGKTESKLNARYIYAIFWLLFALLISGIVKQLSSIKSIKTKSHYFLKNLIALLIWSLLLLFFPPLLGLIFNRGLNWKIFISIDPGLASFSLLLIISQIVISLFNCSQFFRKSN